LVLNNLSKRRALLPSNDPLHLSSKSFLPPPTSTSTPKQSTAPPSYSSSIMSSTTTSYYASLSHTPLSLLYSIYHTRQRIRVSIRYIDSIRGNSTGYVLTFDKHFSMILRDVDEVYTSRITKKMEFREIIARVN